MALSYSEGEVALDKSRLFTSSQQGEQLKKTNMATTKEIHCLRGKIKIDLDWLNSSHEDYTFRIDNGIPKLSYQQGGLVRTQRT